MNNKKQPWTYSLLTLCSCANFACRNSWSNGEPFVLYYIAFKDDKKNCNRSDIRLKSLTERYLIGSLLPHNLVLLLLDLMEVLAKKNKSRENWISKTVLWRKRLPKEENFCSSHIPVEIFGTGSRGTPFKWSMPNQQLFSNFMHSFARTAVWIVFAYIVHH